MRNMFFEKVDDDVAHQWFVNILSVCVCVCVEFLDVFLRERVIAIILFRVSEHVLSRPWCGFR